MKRSLGVELPVNRLCKLPLRSRNHAARRLARIPHRQHIARILRRRHRVLCSTDVACHQMPKRNLRHRLGWHQVAAQQTGNRLAILLRDRRIKTQRVRAGRVPLPAQADNREAVAQQPRVPSIVGGIPVAAVNQETMRDCPRFGFSRIIEPLLLRGSFGRIATKSAENSTSPFFRLTALRRSTIRWLWGLLTETEK